MGIKRDEHLLAKIFDSEHIVNPELREKFYRVSRGGLSFDLFLSPFEEFVTVILKQHENKIPIFDFSMNWVEEIRCKNDTVTLHKVEGGAPDFVVRLAESLFFQYDIQPKKSFAFMEYGIGGYEDYELLEVFDDANFNGNGKKIEKFYTYYGNDYKFTLSISHETNQITLALKDLKADTLIFDLQFYNIKKIKRDKNSLRFFAPEESEDECFNLVVKPFVSINGSL